MIKLISGCYPVPAVQKKVTWRRKKTIPHRENSKYKSRHILDILHIPVATNRGVYLKR